MAETMIYLLGKTLPDS